MRRTCTCTQTFALNLGLHPADSNPNFCRLHTLHAKCCSLWCTNQSRFVSCTNVFCWDTVSMYISACLQSLMLWLLGMIPGIFSGNLHFTLTMSMLLHRMLIHMDCYFFFRICCLGNPFLSLLAHVSVISELFLTKTMQMSIPIQYYVSIAIIFIVPLSIQFLICFLKNYLKYSGYPSFVLRILVFNFTPNTYQYPMLVPAVCTYSSFG